MLKRRLFVFVLTENILTTRLFENDDVTIMMSFPWPSFSSNTILKWRVVVVFLNSSASVWTENIWCVFRVTPPFSNSSGVVWTGPHCHFIAFRWWIVQLVKNFSRQELIERNILSPKNNHNGRLFTIVDFKPSTKISMCLHDPFSYRSLPAFNRIRKGRKYLFPRARFFRLKKQTFSSN